MSIHIQQWWNDLEIKKLFTILMSNTKKNELNTTDGYNKKLYMSFSRKRDSIYGSIKWNEW